MEKKEEEPLSDYIRRRKIIVTPKFTERTVIPETPKKRTRTEEEESDDSDLTFTLSLGKTRRRLRFTGGAESPVVKFTVAISL